MATLPTAWLAPPDNLSNTNHSTNISPAPIAISASIALIVATTVLILFLCKNKDVFLDDRIPDAVETEPAPTAPKDITRITSHPPTLHNPRHPQRSRPTHAKPKRRLPSLELQPKLDELLEFKNMNWDSEHGMQTPRLPPARQHHFTPSYVYDRSDVDTLRDDDDEKNSAYVPYPRSEASDDRFGYGKGRSRGMKGLRVLGDDDDYDDGVVFRSSPSFASRTDLGDAY